MPAPTTPAQALGARLLATAGVTALVDTRVWPVKPSVENPQLPYLIYYKAAGGDGLGLSGRMKLQNYEMRVEAHGLTEADAEAVRLAAVAAVDGWVDPANNVKGCFPMGDADQDADPDNPVMSGQTLSLWFIG